MLVRRCSASANRKNNNKIINVRIRQESCEKFKEKIDLEIIKIKGKHKSFPGSRALVQGAEGGTELGWVDWFRIKILLDLMIAEIQKIFVEWEGPVDLTNKIYAFIHCRKISDQKKCHQNICPIIFVVKFNNSTNQ